jgi:hypothetical protein
LFAPGRFHRQAAFIRSFYFDAVPLPRSRPRNLPIPEADASPES